MRRILFAAVAALLFVPAHAFALNEVACWNRNLEKLDNILNPPDGGDNEFFTSVAQRASVTVVFMNHREMLQFPHTLYELRTLGGGAGCTNTILENLNYFYPRAPVALKGLYSAAKLYPTPETTYIEPPYTQNKLPSNAAFSGQYDNTRYYKFLNWDRNCGAGCVPQTSAIACTFAGVTSTECVACVTTKGYWLNPNVADTDVSSSAGVFAGNWMNFYPPRHVVLRLAMKNVALTNQIDAMRMSVISNDDGNGAVIKNSFQPSCSGAGTPVNGVIAGVEAVPFNINHNPIAEVLFNTGQYISRFGRYHNSSGTPERLFPSSGVLKSGLNEKSGNSKSICTDCERNFMILFSDGRGDEGNPYCGDAGTGAPLPCVMASRCNDEGMGNEDDGNNFVTDNNTYARSIVGDSVRTTPGGTCDRDYADDVARFLYSTDLQPDSSFPSKNNVSTYVVGVGSARYNRMTMLREIARAGGGFFVDGQDYEALESGIKNILVDIARRATSFSVSAITTVQTRGTTFAFIPRFRPDTENRWEGRLFRWKLFNEFASGCTAADSTSPMNAEKRKRNPDGDSDCNDVYLMDTNNKFVGEDSDGEFRLLNNAVSTPWPLSSTYATPVWDAASELQHRNLVTDGRTIWTVLDSDGDGAFEPVEKTAFNVANAALITPYLALGGANSSICGYLSSRTLNTYLTEVECAIDVIKFILGEDVMDQDADNNRTEPREKILADIFHSAPVLVTPPTPRFLCDLGVSTQCTFSLYSPKLTKGGEDAYAKYFSLNQHRDQFVLVGSNDGILHAFHAAKDQLGDDPETAVVESLTSHYFDLGTGAELWGFIGPDILPKLKRYVMAGSRHEILLDGTPMIRDVWVDSIVNPGEKDCTTAADCEFHTMVIMGQRQGGRSYFALDITNPALPQFRWNWPPPTSTYAMAMGETWNDLAPSAPPIGAIAVDDPSSTLTIAGAKAREKYAVFLNGGYDANLIRGRAVFALDVWTGANLWTFSPLRATVSTDPQMRLFPVAAPVTMLDLVDQDGVFDTGVVGDLAGQVWTMRFHNPGKDDDADGIFDNWFGARAFVQFDGSRVGRRSPFFQLAAATLLLDSGNVRVYLGAGDRMNIRDRAGGDCGLANLSACVRKDCTVDVNALANHNGVAYTTGRWTFTAGASSLSTSTLSSTAADGSGFFGGCSDAVSGDYAVNVTCGSTNQAYRFTAKCTWESGTDCPVELDKPIGTRVDRTYTTENSRFYSIKLFDSNRRAPFTTMTEATTYDTNRLRDSNLIDADGATPSTSTGDGYYVRYPLQDERSASGTGILAGCALWNTLTPTAVTAGTCGTVLADTAKLYRAHFITGLPACGQPGSTPAVRSVARSTIAPPPMPTPVVSVNPITGEVRYSVIQLEPGAPPAQISLSQSEVLGTIHWLEVPRSVHECRHAGGPCK